MREDDATNLLAPVDTRRHGELDVTLSAYAWRPRLRGSLAQPDSRAPARLSVSGSLWTEHQAAKSGCAEQNRAKIWVAPADQPWSWRSALIASCDWLQTVVISRLVVRFSRLEPAPPPDEELRISAARLT